MSRHARIARPEQRLDIQIGCWLAALCAATVLMTATLGAHDPVGTKVTWNRDISRLVQARCTRCHREGGPAPMPLGTYEQARPWARAILEEVAARRMPRWHAARGYGAFRNDPSLSPFEITLFAAWVNGGAPRGAAADAAVPASESVTPASPRGREIVVQCGQRRLPSGELLAVRPELAKGGSLGISLIDGNGRRTVLGWIRDYDPAWPETYWLRTPARLDGHAWLITEGEASCRVVVTLSVPRPRTKP